MKEKSYSCKNEELPVIAGYLSFSLKRDLPFFQDFSPKYNNGFIENFDEKISIVSNVLSPHAETVELKAATEHLYNAMDNLLDPIAKLERYIKMAGNAVPINSKDFGLSKIRQRIWARDAEGVLDGLKTVNSYIETYKTALTAQGLSTELINLFISSTTTINEYNQKQYEIISSRKRLVENNQHLFNELYAIVSEICDIGKVIFRSNVAIKKEYTFAELKKQVRNIPHPQVAKQQEKKEE
ncbi:MAG: hypothetical protein LBC98_10885 [Prevotellaceae bacterium]|jgi:hypothetical protein|nr:hypothetical protein [Prevotellaceae bacterium]